MRHILRLLICLAILFIPSVKAQENVDVYLFHSYTCEHCKAEIEYLKTLDNINLHLYETNDISSEESKANAKLFNKVSGVLNENAITPFTIIGTNYYVGFSEGTKKSIELLIEKEFENPSINIFEKIVNDEDISNIKIAKGNIDTIEFFGNEINLLNLSLPLVSIIVGFIDGFNPCAMWVLLFLISMILNMKNRKKMWAIGLTFLVTSAIVYMTFMLAWLQIAITLTQISWVRLIIALIALLGGAINLTSYYKERKKSNGCQVVDSKKRKNIFGKIKDIVTNAEGKGKLGFVLALLGVVGLAISVNLIELACSSGLPLVFTQILAINDLSNLQYVLYILIYIIFFLIDDIVVFTIAMKTLKVTGISTKYNKLSHLIGGIIMILIGVLMIFKPDWLMFNF